MLMIPLPFLPASGLIALAVWLGIRYPEPLRAHWLIAFLCGLALQLVLLGIRYGYGLDVVLLVQHLTGFLIPPLAYLAFKNPPLSVRVAAHILPLAIMWLVVSFATNFVDTVLAFITFGYAAALAATGLAGNEALSWAPLRHGPILRIGLWAAVITLVLFGVTDLIVAVDFHITGGVHTKSIAAGASIVGIALLALSLVYFRRSYRPKQSAENAAEDQALVNRLSAELDRNQLFRDPDLTLGRLAKRLIPRCGEDDSPGLGKRDGAPELMRGKACVALERGTTCYEFFSLQVGMRVPARQISQAINRGAGLNVSQFVNNRRIEEVCNTLATSEVSVTSAMLEAGFLTKSNFNREFRRVMGQSPSV